MTTEEYNWKLYEAGRANNEKNEAAKWAINDFSDKWLMSLSAGSFGLSFAFIEKLVPMNKAVDKPLLIAAWVCFVVVIVLEIIAMEVASVRIDRSIRKENDDLILRYQGIEPEPVKSRIIFDINRVWGYITLLGFFSGMGCLITFVAMNILV